MKEIVVDDCCTCPFADNAMLYDWSEYECGIILDSHKQMIPAGTEEPPKWCPLRQGDHVVRLEVVK